jgi:hypothetical protein
LALFSGSGVLDFRPEASAVFAEGSLAEGTRPYKTKMNGMPASQSIKRPSKLKLVEHIPNDSRIKQVYSLFSLRAFSLEPEHFAPRGLAFGFARIGSENQLENQRSLQRFPLRVSWRPYGRWGDPASLGREAQNRRKEPNGKRRKMKTDQILRMLILSRPEDICLVQGASQSGMP